MSLCPYKKQKKRERDWPASSPLRAAVGWWPCTADWAWGKTAFVRGMARGFGLEAQVSSPTFALVNEYGGQPPFVHFDMYRVSGWDDLMTTGFFDYLDSGAVMAVEWSERIESALPDDAVRVSFERLDDNIRRITLHIPF